MNTPSSDAPERLIDRRTFLQGVLTGVAGTVLASSVLHIPQLLVDGWQFWKLDDETFNLIFGDVLTSFSVETGYAHPTVQGIHPDNLAALTHLRDLIDPEKAVVETHTNNAGRINVNDNLICLGGPMSSVMVRRALEYSEPDNTMTSHRATEPILPLPFEYALEPEELGLASYMLGGQKHSVPNWSITSRTQKLYVTPPEVAEGMLRSDYLLLTKIPSILTSEAYHSGKKVLVIGGCHGVGTRSVRYALDQKEIQRGIVASVGDSEYFQILVRFDLRLERSSRGPEVESCSLVAARPLAEFIDRERIIQGLSNRELAD